MLEEPRVDFGVSGTILGLAAGFLSELSGVLSGVLGVDGDVTDGVEGGALGGAFLRHVFGFRFEFGDGGSLGVGFPHFHHH